MAWLNRSAVGILVCGLWIAAPADAPAEEALVPHQVEVSRIKPAKETRRTLRFLQENIDFLRSQLDQLATRERESSRTATSIDPATLELGRLLREAETAVRGSGDPAEDAEGARWIENLESLLAVEAALADLDHSLDEQSGRLSALTDLYLVQPPTALIVARQGGTVVAGLRLIDDTGLTRRIDLPPDAELQQSLERGGLALLVHERVEPRRQTWACVVGDAAPVFVTFQPTPGSTSLLILDLEGETAGIPLRASLVDLELP